MIPYLLAAVGGYLLGDSMKDSEKFAKGGNIQELLPKEKMLSLLKKTKFKSFDSSKISQEYFNYYTSTFNPFDDSFALEINANPCLIIIRKYDDYYQVKIGENTGWVGGILFPYWDYIFEIPTINYEEFEKGLNKVVSDDRVVLYTEKYGEYKIYFVGSLEDAIEFAKENGYKKVNDNGMYGMYFSKVVGGKVVGGILQIGTFTDRQIEYFGGIREFEPIWLFESGGYLIGDSMKDSQKFAKGGQAKESYLHMFKLKYPNYNKIYVYDGDETPRLSTLDAMNKLGIQLYSNYGVSPTSYKYSGVSSSSDKYKKWYELKKKDYTDEEAYKIVFEDTQIMKAGGEVYKLGDTWSYVFDYDGMH